MYIIMLQKIKWLETLEEEKEVQSDLQIAKATLKGTVDDLQQELQREKVY